LVVPIGGPAVRFARKHRERLFPGTPMLLAAVDERHLQDTTLAPNEAVVAVRHDPPLLVEDVLRLVPATTNIVVVFGNSPIEKFWVAEFLRSFSR
jgi:hypothetical protein